jgi:hypothetical protein
MANMKQAVSAAAAFVGDLFQDARDIRLEEIVAHGPVWHVVLSFVSATDNPLAMLGTPPRIFKQVEIQRDSGEPVALRVWKS